MKKHFYMFASYNMWANERLYEAAQALSAEDFDSDQGAFFKSLSRTLNHLLVTDRIWMWRFTKEGEASSQLDTILFTDFEELKAARKQEDARILAYIDGLNDDQLNAPVRYRSISNPQEFEQPLGSALLHLFNHQTHHRGQAHTILTRLTGEAPSFDLILFQRASGLGLQ